jgi:hypothetical protein
MDQTKVEEVMPNGRRKFSLVPVEAAVDPAILKVDPKTVLPFGEIAKSRGWTVAEIEAYIASDFTEIPARLIRRKGNAPSAQNYREQSAPGGEKVVEAVENAYEDGVESASEDDLPF